MNHKLFLSYWLLSSFLSFAHSELTVTLINQSHDTLEFDYARVDFPGNKVSIDMTSIPPGNTAIITGTTTEGFDLSARLFFKQHGRFRIIDYRQFHAGQPVFSMQTNHIRSRVASKTFNPIKKPRLLSIIAATVILTDATFQNMH